MTPGASIKRRPLGLVDRRLLRQAGAARGYLAVAAGLGLAGAALILLQADLLSRALAGAARGTGLAALAAVLAWLAVVAGRAASGLGRRGGGAAGGGRGEVGAAATAQRPRPAARARLAVRRSQRGDHHARHQGA